MTFLLISILFLLLRVQKLLKMTSKLSIGECAGGHRVENRDKNRDVSIVPRK